jgi:hypothetical protein
MNWAFSPLRNVVVWQSEVIELGHSPSSRPTPPPLPLYVEPASEEALLSWLSRLATRLGVSFHTLAKESFGIDDRLGHSHWWRHPPPGVLVRIASRTGVSVTRLRRMTLTGFEPAYRDDEATARFAGRHYDSRVPLWRRHCFAICGPCLEGDTTPYLRTTWLIGWMAVCPHHRVILIERCKACGYGLRVPPLAKMTAFSPATCTRCGSSLLDGRYHPAHPSVSQIQAAMLRGKHQGITELEGLGRLTWIELVSLADVLIGMIWTDLTAAEQAGVFLMYASDPFAQLTDQDTVHECRHGSLRLLAWLTQDWPDSPGAQVGQNLLTRWLTAALDPLYRHLPPLYGQAWSTGPTNLEPAIRARLQALVGEPL